MSSRYPSGRRIATPAGVLLALLGVLVGSGWTRAQEGEAPGKRIPELYTVYAAVLAEFVDDDGMVDYRGLKDDRAGLDAFISALGETSRSDHDDWSREQKIAFWINAYNALTLRAVIDHYPIEADGLSALRFPTNSIRQIDGVWTDLEWTVLGRRTTLDKIEHEVLRAEFKEPRIHVALVCAAMGCPELRREPYLADHLDEQFKAQAEEFFRDGNKFRIDRAEREVHLSPIFKWFGDDFKAKYAPRRGFEDLGREEAAVMNFVAQHVRERDASWLSRVDFDIEWLDYDWSLNEQR